MMMDFVLLMMMAADGDDSFVMFSNSASASSGEPDLGMSSLENGQSP